MLLMGDGGGNYRLSNPSSALMKGRPTDGRGRSLAECNKLAVYPTQASSDASRTRSPLSSPLLSSPSPQFCAAKKTAALSRVRRFVRPCATCQTACQKSIQKRIVPARSLARVRPSHISPHPAIPYLTSALAKVMNYVADPS